MTVHTSGGHAVLKAQNTNVTRKAPLYAALFFPVFGLVGITLGGRKGKKNRLRFAMLMIALVAVLSFAGCGGVPGITTPAGTYQLTVTAASATVQVDTPVTLTVVE
jgi:hypothetical protein